MIITWERMAFLLLQATGETFYMVGVTTVIAILLGFPLGLLLYVTKKGSLGPSKSLYSGLSFFVNIGRSIPFAILIVAVIPVTRWILGTSIGTSAAIIPLTLGSIPFYARLVESVFAEVPGILLTSGVIMGSSLRQIVIHILIPESFPGLVRITSLLMVTIINYTALAGLVGGGGLGALAIQYGYQRFDVCMMVSTVFVLVIIVEMCQAIGLALEQAILRQRGIHTEK